MINVAHKILHLECGHDLETFISKFDPTVNLDNGFQYFCEQCQLPRWVNSTTTL